MQYQIREYGASWGQSQIHVGIKTISSGRFQQPQCAQAWLWVDVMKHTATQSVQSLVQITDAGHPIQCERVK